MSEITPPVRPTVDIQRPPARLPEVEGAFVDCLVQPSSLIGRGYAWLALAAIAALLLAVAPLWRALPFTALGALLVGLTGLLVLVRGLWLHWRAGYWQLRLDRDGWQLATPGGPWQPVRLHPRALVWPQLVILGFVHHSRRRPLWLVLAPDSCDPDSWRRLRTWLLIRLSSPRPY